MSSTSIRGEPLFMCFCVLTVSTLKFFCEVNFHSIFDLSGANWSPNITLYGGNSGYVYPFRESRPPHISRYITLYFFVFLWFFIDFFDFFDFWKQLYLKIDFANNFQSWYGKTQHTKVVRRPLKCLTPQPTLMVTRLHKFQREIKSENIHNWLT